MMKLLDSCNELEAMDTASRRDLRLEYEKTQDMATHYDRLNWSIGSILVAGVFIMIGVVGDEIQLYPYLAFFSFVALLIWRLYYKRHKEIQQVKFRRLHDIEKVLRLQQHLRVDCADKRDMTGGLRGDDFANILTIGMPAALVLAYLAWRLFSH